jgi:hypothetical protein
MLFREILPVYSEKHMKLINTPCAQNTELMNVTAGSTYSNRFALKGSEFSRSHFQIAEDYVLFPKHHYYKPVNRRDICRNCFILGTQLLVFRLLFKLQGLSGSQSNYNQELQQKAEKLRHYNESGCAHPLRRLHPSKSAAQFHHTSRAVHTMKSHEVTEL